MRSQAHPHYWLGVLSMTMAQAVGERDPSESRRLLERSLKDYLRSPVPSEEVKRYLREEMR